MDPIAPITPRSAADPAPVAAPARLRRTDRDQGRGRDGRREAPTREPLRQHEDEDGGDGHPHVDLTA